jgi:hypothetical protein
MDPALEEAILEDDTDEETALYQVLFVRRGADGKLRLVREVSFDRLDLSIVRQKEFDEHAAIVSDTHYLKWQPYNGVMFPGHIDISRQVDGYGVTMDILEMQMNKNLTDDQFVLVQPEGTTLRNISGTAPADQAR